MSTKNRWSISKLFLPKNIPSKQRLKPKKQKAKINVKYVSTDSKALFTLSALVWNKVKRCK